LELKVGARVMAAKNDPGHRWVNGSLAAVRHRIIAVGPGLAIV
jgi:hypothetical protein